MTPIPDDLSDRPTPWRLVARVIAIPAVLATAVWAAPVIGTAATELWDVLATTARDAGLSLVAAAAGITARW